MPVKKPNEDDERLSALLDGRVQGQQREELLAHLSANEDDYAVFTSTAAALRALEEEDARAAGKEQEDVIPLRRPSRGPWLPMRSLAVAASIATIALVGTLTLRTSGAGAGDPVQLAERAGPQGLPAGWDRTPWSGVRGSGSASPDQEAVRAGAMLVQLAAAAQVGDTAAVRLLAQQLNERYGRGTGAGTSLRRIADRSDTSPDSLTALIGQATDRLARGLGPKPLELGAWVEAARLAAKHQRDEFFDDGASRGMLRRAERLEDDDAAVGAAVDRVRDALRVDRPSRWAALENSLTALLIEIAS